jgi:predicted amidohydrolase YtcJ
VKGGQLTKRDLDVAFPKHKVMVLHVSLHGAVLNSKALQWAGISRETPTPEGGIIARGPDGKDPEGLLMETAFLPVFAKLPQPGEAEMLDLLKPGQMMYAENGFTLANEGYTHAKDIRLLQKAAAQNRLFIDIVSLPGFSEMDQWLNKSEFPFGQWNNRLKLQGIKITQDGSVQGKTASYLEPLLTGGPQGQKDWRGNSTLPYDDFAKLFDAAHKAGLQRAAFLSSMAAAMDAGLKASNHTDFNVTPLDPFFVLWTSMARTTRSGYLLGPDLRIDAYRGLQALTINPAWAYREEARRGSIAPGKLADFVIVSGDPVKTPVEQIRDVKIIETIKEGKTIYKRD